MKKTLLFIILMNATFMFSQNKTFWQKQAPANRSQIQASKQNLPKTETYRLNIEALKQALSLAPKRGTFSGNSNLIISFPNAEGQLEQFRIMEASVMHPDLAARYPGIKSYAGQGIDDPTARIRFSVSPLGLQSMRLSGKSSASFIEPLTNDLSQYTVYKKADKTADLNKFECTVTNTISRGINSDGFAMRNADDGTLRTYRLAMSATGEYTSYHGGSKANALAAMNTTMTRVNGIFETDFNVTMVLIANNDDVIYTNSGSDPYSNNLNSQVQSTLSSVIGESNYDIGHLVHQESNSNGNAGCIGCVCVNNQKGSAFTSHITPVGDNFDIDFVAHEMGHQFGGNHTWTHGGNEGTNVQMEPGSGSTIMGYAGITGSTDVQAHSDAYFHAINIEQITDYVKSTSCQTNTNTGNAVPTANAGSNYTIPKGTPFVLEGSGSDANAGNVLTYCWEQMNENNASTTNPSVNATSGIAFRSYTPTTNTERYFPRLSTIKTGGTSWQWEAVPNVARTLNFRLTVRDNVAGGANNNSDDTVITVNGTAGPFVLNSPNTNVTWNAGTTQTVTWNVAGTTGNGVNAANVDIFLSTDGGDTYPITLASGVTNDGSHDIVVSNNQGSQNRIMVRGSNHIFFDISNTNFTISGTVVCNADVPTGLAASNVGATTATLSWNSVSGATYDLRYRTVGSSTWNTNAVTGISSNLTGLNTLTQYEAQVRSKCSGGSNSAYSSSVNFTTTDVQLNYCSSASTNINDEFIGRVQLNTIDNSSGGQFYTDFTNISTTLTKDTQYTITVTPTWTGTIYSEGYSVWIDYNSDGDFTDAGEQVWSQAATQNTPVSGSFTIPSGAVENSTRMRVSMKYNSTPTSCESFQYGEVEDYTVIIEGSGPDTTAPIITLNGSSTLNLNVGDTYTEQGATATDNVDGDLTSSIVTAGDTVNTNVAGTYVVTYNVSDAAGNTATEVTRTLIVTADTTAPVIILNGSSTMNLNVGDTYTEQGATASDNVDGDITANIVIGGDTVNTNAAGTYVVTYNVSDNAGNNATQVTRTVNVSIVPDTTAPVITLNGSATINLNVGDTYTEQGATATDNIDGDLTSSIVIGGATVNTNTAGTYLVAYNVSDAAGNAATQVIRTVNVTEPSTGGCSGGITSFPYSEGFENTLGAWTQSTADDLDWTVDANGTPSSGTGPSSANQGTYYVYVEASVNGTGYPDKRAILNSPCFDLSGLSAPSLSFDYHMFGAADMGTIDLEISTDNGSSWSSIWSNSGNQGNTWFTINLDLSAYVGGSVQVRFNRFVGSTWQADIAIDNFSISEPVVPTCSDGIQNGDETGVDCGGSSCAPCTTSDVVLNEGYFETGWDSWTDGGSDCFRYSGTRSFEGNYSIRIRDNSGTGSAMTLSNINVTPYSQVVIDFYFYVNSMENGEDFWLRFYDGSSWNTVATYVSGSGINNGSFYQGTVTITSAQYNFASNSGFRFQNDASGNNDQIYIDQVTITGTNSAKGEQNSLVEVGTLRAEAGFEDDFKLYPNPVKGDILNIQLLEGENFSYRIMNMVGQTIAKGNSKGQVNVSNLDAGMYFIEVNDGEEIMTKKFIKN